VPSWTTHTLGRLASLPLVAETVEVGRLERSDGRRRTALVRLRGGGHEGLGEEVTFQPEDMLRAPPTRAFRQGAGTLGELWERLDPVDLFARPPRYEAVRDYRRWAFEAAALDLSLRQAGLSLGDVLGRRPQPLRFVVSSGFRAPGVRLKLDAAELAPGLPVDVVDFKGEGEAALVHRALELYPDALLEDPPVVVDGARVSWDLGIRSPEDLDRLAFPPAAINVKPARVGGVRALFELYGACAERGIAVYGGGQDELGAGRAQIQLLAALFHPDAPNDVAPSGYNDANPPAGLPSSPLVVSEQPGFAATLS
jgi:hypothetical protein